MTEASVQRGAGHAPAPSRAVRVWDPLVRFIHWGVAGAVLLNGALIEDESQAHELIGYAAVALVATRLLWGVVGTQHARFSAFPPNPFAAIRHLGGLFRARKSVHLSHNPAGALMVYNLWATLIGMGVTGWMMGQPAWFGLQWVEELHEGLFGWLMVSVALHVAAVVLDGRLSGVNLLRAMLDGKKRIPRGTETE